MLKIKKIVRVATLQAARELCSKIEKRRHRAPTFTGIYRGHRGYVVQITTWR